LSSSPLLDEYVDGTLSPVQRAEVQAHIETCAECELVLAELRVVDALLLSPRRVELAPNFTFRVMAEVRSIPAPHRRRTPLLQVTATYLAFAWAAIAAWFVFAPESAHESMAMLRDVFVQYGAAGSALSGMLSQALGRGVLGVTASVWAILGLDIFAAVTAVAVYLVVRPRLAAYIGARPEGR
jgi:anti-sigma factor RsiW